MNRWSPKRINWNPKKVFASWLKKEQEIDTDDTLSGTNVIRQQMLVAETGRINTKPTFFRMLVFSILVIIGTAIQEGIFSSSDVKPFFALTVCYCLSFFTETRPAMFFGLGVGLYIDIVYGRFFGYYAFILMFVCVFASLIAKLPDKKRGTKQGDILFMILAALPFLTLFNMADSLCARLMFIYTTQGAASLYADYGSHFLKVLLPEIACDFVTTAIFVFPLQRLWKVCRREKSLK